MDARVLHHEVTDGPGATVVLVPGGLTGIRSLDPIAEGLAARRHRVVAVDPIANELGGGGQVGDPSYDAEVERESLRLTVEAAGGRAPVHLLGWSNGGRAALALAAGHPDLVRSVTAVEPAAWWLAEDPGAADLEALMSAAAGRDVTDDELHRFLEIVRVAPPGTSQRELPGWEVWRSVRNALSWYGPRVAETVPAQFVPEQIRHPVLLARGTWTAPWLREVVEVLAARLPDARVLELEGGHACLLQRAEEFLEAAAAHVAAHP